MNPEQTPFTILIVVAPLLASVFVPVLGRRGKKICYPLVIIAVSISLLSSLIVASKVLTHGPVQYYLGGWAPPWGIEFYVDHLNAFMAVLVSFISLLGAIYSKKTIEKELPGKEGAFYCLFLLLFMGLLGIVLTGDLFNLYVFLEVAALSSYALIAMGEKGATYASFRYLVVGTLGASWYLLGVGYLYIMTGSLNMANLSELLPDLYQSKAILVGFVFILMGVGIKMAQFPLHAWLPDAYTRAPSAVSAIIAPLMTKVMVYVIIRVMFTVFRPEFSSALLRVTDIMAWFGAFAILFGGIMALSQTDFKRMLSYIIVAEVGYFIGGIGTANGTALKGVVFHILNDAVMMACLYWVAGMVAYRTNGHNISDFRGIFRKMPITATIFTVGALAVIGVPPTGGFFSKWYLLLGGIEAKHWEFVIALLIGTLINIALFVRVFDKSLYVHGSDHASEQGKLDSEIDSHEAPLSMLIPAITLAVCIFLVGIFNQAIMENVIEFTVPSGLLQSTVLR